MIPLLDKMKSFKQFQEAAIAVPLIGAGAKTLLKVGGAYAAAKGGEKILKDLLGTPGRQKATDWDKNPKDKIDQELNVRQNQAKDRAKNKDFDTDMDALRKGEKNISPEDKIQRLKDAAKKHRKNVSRANSVTVKRWFLRMIIQRICKTKNQTSKIKQSNQFHFQNLTII